jgi:hypothetical protein
MRHVALVLFVTGIMQFAAAAGPAGTTITYQGRLIASGAPANGPHDMQFWLYDASSGGSQMGPAITLQDVPVSSGLFTVQLDFGGDPFAGNALWLQVSIDGSLLSPRQPRTPAPYSLGTRGFGIDAAGNLTLDSLSAAHGTMTVESPGGIELILDADTNNGGGEDQNARIVLRQDGGAVAARLGYENNNELVLMQEYTDELRFGTSDIIRMTIAADGRVGINTTPGAFTFHQLSVHSDDLGGILGSSDSETVPYGVHGVNSSLHGVGVFGEGTGDLGTGVHAVGQNVGVLAESSTGIAVRALGVTGLYAQGPQYAIVASGDVNIGGEVQINGDVEIDGDLHVQGLLTKLGGSFKIDHPLDPANKYLVHSFIESPDMMNIYNGNVVLDERGEAVVELPGYFQALNRDFRYQLTCIGAAAPVYIAQEVQDNRFRIAGGAAGMKVSWQVTGIRQDAWAAANPLVVEPEKGPARRGTYLAPELYSGPDPGGAQPSRAASAGGAR